VRLFHIVLALGLSILANTAVAQEFPDKSKVFKIILPQGPGSASDGLARAYARAMAEVASLNVIVDYKPGAETVIGVQALKNSPPDGYTMLLASSSTQVINVLMMPNVPYDPFTDFVPLTGVSKAVLAMNLGPSVPFKSAREFISAARANPGKYSFASSTSTTRLAGELLQANAGIKLLNVPYKTTGAAVTALAAGEVDSMIVDPSSVASLWQSGRVRAVATSGASRTRDLAQLPTLREEGVSEYEITAWFSMYYPAKTPPETVAAMRNILGKAAKTSVVAEALKRAQMEPLELVGDEVTALNRRELDVLGKVVRAANLRPQQ
jgi:tripartite-type tricarboxylate transporter receptor subunit TctC